MPNQFNITFNWLPKGFWFLGRIPNMDSWERRNVCGQHGYTYNLTLWRFQVMLWTVRNP